MTYIKYAEALNDYFVNPKYIYLYRDGRDVTLSFTKAVVGDKHPYMIAQKWAELQRLCIAERERSPERVFGICYEELTAEPETVLRRLCQFLGVTYKDTMLNGHNSAEANRTAESSSLWGNLTKPVMRNNSQKFLKGLNEEEVRMIEYVAGDCLDALDYSRVYVPRGQERTFSEHEIEQFRAINHKLIQ